MDEMKRLDWFEVKEVAEDGTFTGIASVYGVEDLEGDVIDKGAFSKTISENPVVPILWQHDSREVIGEGKVREWQGKIYIDGQLDLDDPTAAKAYGKLKKKLMKGLSIGFSAVKTKWEEIEARSIRHITELKLWEVSVVTFPALPAAQVMRVKSPREEALEKRLAAMEEKLKLIADPTPGEVTTPDPVDARLSAEPEATKQTPITDHSAAIATAQAIKALVKEVIDHGTGKCSH
jgi:uncharacterized protein